MSIVVYTCITGGKDSLKPQPQEEGVRYVCFSDQPFTHPQWEYKKADYHRSKRRTARKHKILSHKYFPEANHTIWIDASMQLKKKPSYYVDRYMKHHDIACRPHPTRNCIYEEMIAVQNFNYENSDVLIEQCNYLLEEGYPKDYSLGETGLLVRNTSFHAINFNEKWWEVVEKYSHRDQLSFDYISWKTDTVYRRINRNDVYWFPHKIPTTEKD